MGATVHSESFFLGDYSMRDLSEDSNSCSWSVYCGDKNLGYGQYQNGVSMRAAAADSYLGYEKDFMKQTMLEHEAIFKNQVHELHRLYRIQRNLIDEVKGQNMNEDMSLSDHTSENASKRQLSEFLLANSMRGEGSSSQACNGHMQNGVSSKDGGTLEVRPVKFRRNMIDLQLPADEYLDTDETGDTHENTNYPSYERSISGKELGENLLLEKRASHQNNSSGSCLDVKNSNGLADLNEPLQWQESEPVARDIYSHYERNNAHAQGQWMEKNKNQNGWMVLEAGRDRSIQRDQMRLPSYSVQVRSNNAFQPLSYPTTDHDKVKFPGERAHYELEARSKNPEVSYDSYVESSVASNAPSLHNDYRPDFVRPLSHWPSSWENSRSSSHQKSYPVQTNPLLTSDTHARVDSSFEMRSRISNGCYQGFSPRSKEAVLKFPSINFNYPNNGPKGVLPNASSSELVKHRSFESLQGPKSEYSAGLPWLKPKPSYKSETSNGCLDLNASTNQFLGGSDTGDGLSSASPHKGLRSALSSNKTNMGRVEMIDPLSSRKILGCPIFEKHSICKEEHTSLISNSLCITEQHKEVNNFVKRDLDINLPYDASDSVDQIGTEAICVDKQEGNKTANFRRYIDLNSCASEDEDSALHSGLRVKSKVTIVIDLEAPATLDSEEENERLPGKTKEETWGMLQGEDGNSMTELIKVAAQAIVAISSSVHQYHLDDAVSSSTDAAAQDPLSWLAEIILSGSDNLERKVDGFPEAREGEGCREDCSSGEIDYFEAMTLNLPQTKEEDYMPKPLVPENLKLEGTDPTATTPNRPRRGQARRGRPKRDFQRDILPGITSLSRHEVVEDVQMFGLMKITVNPWSSGVGRNTNRGGYGRGRRRLVTNISQAPVCHSLVQPMSNSVPVVGLEDRRLTGWGKATRRPRRQRCPAGNPPTVILT